MKVRPWPLFLAGILIMAVACQALGRATPTPVTPIFVWTPLPEETEIFIPPTATPTRAGVPVFPASPTQPPAPAGPTVAPTLPPTATPTRAVRIPVIPIRPGPLVEVPRLAAPPTLDGYLDEWQGSGVPVQYATYGRAAYTGPQDASAQVYLGWDPEYLYLAFQVVDDVFVQQARGRNLYRGDSAEILVDTDLFGDRYVRRLTWDDYQLGFSPGSPPGRNPEAWRWYPRAMEGVPEGVRIAAQPWSRGYTMEVAVPWRALSVVPGEGLRMGFVVSISDNDLPGRTVQQTLVSHDPYRRLTDPTTWGEMVLRP